MKTGNLNKMAKALARMREIQSDFPASAMHCFLAVVMNEGLTQLSVSQKTGLPRSTTSRCTRLLSDRLEPGKEGMGLIELRLDPMDYRFKGCYLTEKGKELAEDLSALME